MLELVEIAREVGHKVGVRGEEEEVEITTVGMEQRMGMQLAVVEMETEELDKQL